MQSISSEELIELTRLAVTEADFAEIDRWTEELTNQKPQEKVVDRWKCETLAEVAEFFGLSVQTVKQWRIESPPMPGSDGGWPLKEIVRWRHAKLAQSDLVTAKKRIDLELSQVAVEAKRLELAKDKGELVETAEVERWAATAIVEFREMIMALPDMIGGAAPQELREFARSETERHCRDALTSLLRRLDTDEIPTASDSTDQAT